ncbi:MAG: phenylalanine--tRNA ligase subunit alpha, partial [Candidatus Micrarchaeota archaeon]
RKWKTAELAAYNTSAPVERLFPGKSHPIRKLTDKIRTIFSEMGFEEMEGDPIESAFWNFDSLFQPQDHPARELADTFYLEGKRKLPDESIVKKVAEAHERGWKYKWDGQVAESTVLRTHTTAVSARYVAMSGGEPSKYFCVGRVYRNEQTDFKHLAEFFQVEGIVIWEKATFCDLLGLLKEFYKKLGFEKIRFRPSYFPYTEPSLEVEVFFEERNEWLELGGAGIFRPEVCLPLCGKYPVLAWGLGLERPLMLSRGIKDIRTFYRNDLGWLRNAKSGF